MNGIVFNKTYSSAEAAELIGVNINTFQRLVREGKIRTLQINRIYRVTGAALLEFLGLPQNKSITELQSDLTTISGELMQVLKKEDKDFGVFLLQANLMYANEETLVKLIADMKRYIALSENKKDF